MRLDMPLDSFRAVLERITQGKADLVALMGSHLDRLRAEIADATNQARLATAIVTKFRASCETRAEREITIRAISCGGRRSTTATACVTSRSADGRSWAPYA